MIKPWEMTRGQAEAARTPAPLEEGEEPRQDYDWLDDIATEEGKAKALDEIGVSLDGYAHRLAIANAE